DAAIDLIWIHLFTQTVERTFGENITDLGKQRAAHSLAQQFTHLAGCTFRSLERDIAGKNFCHDDVYRTLADIVAFNKTGIGKSVERCVAQNLASFLDLVETFYLFRPDIQEPDGRFAHLEQGPRHTSPHNGVIDELTRIGAN